MGSRFLDFMGGIRSWALLLIKALSGSHVLQCAPPQSLGPAHAVAIAVPAALARLALFGALIGCLGGCTLLPESAARAQLGVSARPGGVAWGERVAFSQAVRRLMVLDADGQRVAERAFNPPRAAVDLPDAPALPAQDVAAGDPLTEKTFFTPLTTAERAAYMHRGRVVLHLTGGTARTLTPYGAVSPGRLHALASVRGPCSRFWTFVEANLEDPFSVRSKLGVSLEAHLSLCHVTLEIGAQDTGEALRRLEGALEGFRPYARLVSEAGFVVGRDGLSSLDPPPRGEKSFDPTCEQVRRWLDPIGDRGYDVLDMRRLRADLGVSGASVTGRGVRVVLIGGGIGRDDDVRCGKLLAGHDTHVAAIIRALAPDVRFEAFKVCNAQGVCSSAEIVRALLQAMRVAQQHPWTLVHMSLGGPLPDRPSFALLKLLGQRFRVSAVVSGGNGPNAPAHYPASYSRAVAPSSAPSLVNVVPVAATGLKLGADGRGNAGYVIAGFNTRANAVLFAPGVNLCPDTARRFRCDAAQGYPNDLGLTGTSYAAPVVTGLAALYTETEGALPSRLDACLQNNAATDPVTGVSYAVFGKAPCP